MGKKLTLYKRLIIKLLQQLCVCGTSDVNELTPVVFLQLK